MTLQIYCRKPSRENQGTVLHHEYSRVDEDRTLRYRYTYDEANQLVRVDDNIQSKTYTYQYDKGGNRVSEKIYKYTLSNSLGAVQKAKIATKNILQTIYDEYPILFKR